MDYSEIIEKLKKYEPLETKHYDELLKIVEYIDAKNTMLQVEEYMENVTKTGVLELMQIAISKCLKYTKTENGKQMVNKYPLI